MAITDLLLPFLCLTFVPLSLALLPSQLDPTGEHFCDTLQSQLVDQVAAVGGVVSSALLPLPSNPAALGNNRGKGNCSSVSEVPGNVYGVQEIPGNVLGSLSGVGSNAVSGGLPLISSGPLTVLEVTKPVTRVSGSPTCTVTLMPSTGFGSSGYYNTYSGSYNPSGNCGTSWAQVVMTWTASISGTQYDRFAGVWLGGVEILRTTTAEPVSNGIAWTIEKDITQYTALLKSQQSVHVELDNSVDSSLTGVYQVSITLSFFEASSSTPAPVVADVILPLKNPYGYQYGYWFGIQPGTYNSVSNSLTIPTNTLRAVVEVYYGAEGVCSGTGCTPGTNEQEFWYTYPPGTGNPTGAFKEIRVLVDGKVVGVVWPFATIYTGGLNPALWSPVVAIGAFLLPPMAVDITPFLSYFNDGNPHTFTLDMGSTIGYYWLVDANVQCFTDPTLPAGQVLTSEIVSNTVRPDPDFINVSGGTVSAERTFLATGTVRNPSTNVTLSTTVTAQYSFSNNQTYDPTGVAETWNQLTSFTTDVKTVTSDGSTYYEKQSSYSYPMTGSYAALATNIDHSIVSSVTTRQITGATETVKLNYRQQATAAIALVSPPSISSSRNSYTYSDAAGCYNRQVTTAGLHVISDSTTGTGCP